MIFSWLRRRNEKQEQINAIIADDNRNKSQKMRELFALGLDITSIANKLGVRYNFVYNVIMDYLRTNSGASVQDTNSTPETKKQSIINLYNEGHSMTEISKLLKTDYNYVGRVLREYKLDAFKKFQGYNNKNDLKL